MAKARTPIRRDADSESEQRALLHQQLVVADQRAQRVHEVPAPQRRRNGGRIFLLNARTSLRVDGEAFTLPPARTATIGRICIKSKNRRPSYICAETIFLKLMTPEESVARLTTARHTPICLVCKRLMGNQRFQTPNSLVLKPR